jgi:hypothetical protein
MSGRLSFLIQLSGRRRLLLLWSGDMEPFRHVRKTELFDTIVRKKDLVVAMVGRNGAFWTCQEDGAF